MRIDDLIKGIVSQERTYLDLSNIHFKDKQKVIDDWAQSLAIVITNHEGSWDNERFVDYITGTLQGDVLQWMKQWINSEEEKSKRKEWGESNRFASFEKILNDFIKIYKENLCRYINEKS